MKTETKIIKSIKADKSLFDKLEKERLKIKPSPSLHAYMVFKLGK